MPTGSPEGSVSQASQVNGHLTLFFLFQAVRINAGECLNQSGLAVVNVAAVPMTRTATPVRRQAPKVRASYACSTISSKRVCQSWAAVVRIWASSSAICSSNWSRLSLAWLCFSRAAMRWVNSAITLSYSLHCVPIPWCVFSSSALLVPATLRAGIFDGFRPGVGVRRFRAAGVGVAP